MNDTLSFRRFKAIVIKEFIHVIRDWRSLTLAFAIPVMLLLLFAYALNMDLKNIPTAVIDRSNTPESRELAAMFDGSPYFSITRYLLAEKEMENSMKSRQIKCGIVIPQDFAKHINNRTHVQIGIYIDGSDANTGRMVLNYAQALGMIYNTKISVQKTVSGSLQPDNRAWYNEGLVSSFNIVPGITALVMVVIASMLASVTVAKEWETGTMEQLISTPVRRLELTLGKAVPLFIIGMADVFFAVAMGVYLFGVPLRGEPLLVMFTASVFLTGVLFFGLLLSVVLKKQVLANQIAIISGFMPTLILSGFVFTIANMPLPVRVLTHVFPARYFISILKSIYLKGAGLEMFLVNFAFLSIYAVIMVVLTNKKLKLNLDV